MQQISLNDQKKEKPEIQLPYIVSFKLNSKSWHNYDRLWVIKRQLGNQ
jgi:uncharacterized phage-like protein YoqJ